MSAYPRTGLIAASGVAFKIADKIIDQEAAMADYATAPCCIFTMDSEAGPTHDWLFASSTEDDYREKIAHFVDKKQADYPGGKISGSNFQKIENPVFDDIKEARNILLDHILTAITNPPTKFKRRVISHMGNALDQQTGNDPNCKGINNIPGRLAKLCGDKNHWYLHYKNQLHKYHNACKHSGKDKFTKAKADLSSIRGKKIAIEYYESVRLFLAWYLKDKGGELHYYLNSIDYSNTGLKIEIPDI